MLSSHSYHDRHVPLSFQAIKEKKACKRSFFSFGKLLKLVLLLLVAVVAVDIYKHKGYKGKKLFVVSLRLSLFHSGCHRSWQKFFKVKEKSGNFISSQRKINIFLEEMEEN